MYLCCSSTLQYICHQKSSRAKSQGQPGARNSRGTKPGHSQRHSPPPRVMENTPQMLAALSETKFMKIIRGLYNPHPLRPPPQVSPQKSHDYLQVSKNQRHPYGSRKTWPLYAFFLRAPTRRTSPFTETATSRFSHGSVHHGLIHLLVASHSG